MSRWYRYLSGMIVYAAALAVCALLSVRLAANAQAAGAGQEAQTLKNTYYDEWYEVSGDVLTLRLENHIPGYAWKLGSSNDELVKITDYYYDRYDDRIITMEAVPDRTGEVILTAVCMRDTLSRPIGRKQLRVHVYDDGRMSADEISSD